MTAPPSNQPPSNSPAASQHPDLLTRVQTWCAHQQQAPVVWPAALIAQTPVVVTGPDSDLPVELEQFLELVTGMHAAAVYVDHDAGTVEAAPNGLTHRWVTSMRPTAWAARQPPKTNEQRQVIDQLINQLVADATFAAAETKTARTARAYALFPYLHEADQGQHTVLTAANTRELVNRAHEQVEDRIRQAYQPIRDQFDGWVARLNQDQDFLGARDTTARKKRIREILTEQTGHPPPRRLVAELEGDPNRASPTAKQRRGHRRQTQPANQPPATEPTSH